jgi:hypothetical protein
VNEPEVTRSEVRNTWRSREYLRVTYEGPQAGFMYAPAEEGWEYYFIGRVGDDKVTFHYRRDL